jgi:hypothetical protein
MADSRADDASVAPPRSLASPGGGGRVLPPLPEELKEKAKAEKSRSEKSGPENPRSEKSRARSEARPARRIRTPRIQAVVSDRPVSTSRRRSMRKARLRLVQVDAWSVMKTAFLLSIALGIILVVAVAVIWGVLGAAGVWDSINSMVQQTLGSDNSTPFRIQDYVGTSRVLGFAMIVAVVDVILITAIATLGAFVYNLAATLVGGVEVTLAEDL